MPSTSQVSFWEKNEALRNSTFRRFLSFRFFLICALNMQVTILAYWIYDISGNVKLVGELGLWEAIPAITCSLFSGHFVERREKRNLLVVCAIIYIGIASYFLYLTYMQQAGLLGNILSIRLAFIGVLLGGIVRSIIGPSTFSMVGLLAPRKILPNAASWSSTAWYIGAVSGPLLGGLLIGQYGVKASFIIVLCLLSFALISILGVPTQKIINQVKEPVLKSLKKGLSFVFNTPIILSVLSLDMFAVLFGGAVALLPVFAKDILKVGEMGFGIMRAAPGIGAIITMGILAMYPIKKHAGVKMLLCFLGFGLCIIVFGISKSFALSVFMLMLGGLFDAVSVVIRSTVLQLHTPEEMKGRVAAVNTMFISSSNELGEVESGYTAAWMGTIPSVIFGGSMTIVIVMITAILVPSLRKLQIYNDKTS
jgi:MFS family permease